MSNPTLRRLFALLLVALLWPGAAVAASTAKGAPPPTGPEAFPLDRMRIVLPGKPPRLVLLELVLIVDPGQGQLLRGQREAMSNAIAAAVATIPPEQFLDGNEAVRVKKVARQGLDRGGFTQVRDVLINFLQLR